MECSKRSIPQDEQEQPCFDVKTGEITEFFREKLKSIGIYTKIKNLYIETVHDFLQRNSFQNTFYPTEQQARAYLTVAAKEDYVLEMIVAEYSDVTLFAQSKWIGEAEKVNHEYHEYLSHLREQNMRPLWKPIIGKRDHHIE
jgi:hypothetical protein